MGNIRTLGSAISDFIYEKERIEQRLAEMLYVSEMKKDRVYYTVDISDASVSSVDCDDIDKEKELGLVFPRKIDLEKYLNRMRAEYAIVKAYRTYDLAAPFSERKFCVVFDKESGTLVIKERAELMYVPKHLYSTMEACEHTIDELETELLRYFDVI